MLRCPLFHIQETKTKCCLRIAFAVILNDKADAVRCAGKLYRTGCGAAVPFGIGQCFLHRSDQGRMERQRDDCRITADRKFCCDSCILQKSSVSCFSDSISEGSFSVCRVRTDKRTSSSASRASVSQTPTVSSAFGCLFLPFTQKLQLDEKGRHFMPHCIMDFTRHSVPLVNGSQLFNLLRI